jgi:enoyl-CoA hydratase/carnithine racemase
MIDLSPARQPLLTVERQDDIAVVRLDNPPVNATSDAVRACSAATAPDTTQILHPSV